MCDVWSELIQESGRISSVFAGFALGGCARMYQYFGKHGWCVPSVPPALCKTEHTQRAKTNGKI